jgi:streptomycin 6-kinase
VIAVPRELEWWRTRSPEGAAWLDRLPRLVAECAELWELRVGEPFSGGNAALAVPVERADGSAAVLKVNFPERETEREGDALEHWRGEGAVRLLAQDRERRALLLERCEPGTRLWDVDDDEEATRIAAAVLRRIWRAPPAPNPFWTLADCGEWWASYLHDDYELARRPFERSLLDEALAAIAELSANQGEHVVLHQDFHGGNVLRAQREPWLAIDPKPLSGEREFDTASLIRDRRPLLMEPGGERIVRRRLDQLASELELDRERMRRWGIAHAIAWGISPDRVHEAHVEVARMLVRV